jgi:ketosteroid isomerase-like protein
MATFRWLIVLACVSGCGGSQAAPAASGSETGGDVTQGARGLVEQWRQGWELRSVEALGKLYPHDLDVILVEQGRAQRGWTPIELYLSTRLGAAKDVHVKLDDLQVVAAGAAGAAASATITREISDGVATTKETGVVTWTLRAEGDGTWRIIAEHYSYPPTMP